MTYTTVEDVIAALSKYPKGTKFLTIGPGGDEVTSVVSIQETRPGGGDLDNVCLIGWEADALEQAGVTSILGHVKPLHKGRVTQLDHVNVSVEEMDSIPAGASPFRHDSFSMGTDLVRNWIVMHEGYATNLAWGLQGFYLVNQLTGQRVRIKFSPKRDTVEDFQMWGHLAAQNKVSQEQAQEIFDNYPWESDVTNTPEQAKAFWDAFNAVTPAPV